MNVQQIKQRFGLIGNAPLLDRAIEIAAQVAPTDISVMVTGESGTGKESMPQIIHQLSHRKHGKYIAVNCGAIPEGTIDSELFGHEKGSFTGATEARKGYFEVADGGTIFLDEVAELPLTTQVRLLRVLETGEFIRVGSSKVIKTDVRIVAASNVNIPIAINEGKFREDLYYRLNSVPIDIPALRNRGEDIHLLFRKFVSDFAEKYRMPPIRLSDDAVAVLERYNWPGNIRQLKNIVEQISIIETNREIDGKLLLTYLPTSPDKQTPMLLKDAKQGESFSEREILYKVLFDLKSDVTELKQLLSDVIKNSDSDLTDNLNPNLVRKVFSEERVTSPLQLPEKTSSYLDAEEDYNDALEPYEELKEESLSLADTEKDLIQKALQKHKNKRKNAAKELGISERTLYRKIKEYQLS